jgi:DNA-binding CsgD family transcriptional regulator
MRYRASLMVGRDDEVRVLDLALEAARSGHGHAVFVTGEGGIGKSRLAAAVVDLGFGAGMAIMRGRGSAVGPMVPFRSLTEALMSLLRSGEPVDVGALGPYRPVLARLVPDWGPPSAGEEGASLVVVAEAVLRLTALAGRGRGCLIVFDDLQDADAETLAVVEYLVDNLDRQPTVLLGTARTESGSAAGLIRAAAQRGAATVLELARLGPEEVRQLAGSCLENGNGLESGDGLANGDGLAPEPAEQLWADSGGVPLLVEELLRDMVSNGRLVHRGDRWELTSAGPRRVPVTLARSLADQLAGLGDPGRRLLHTAAVLGRRFPLAVVQEATGLSDRELLGHLYADPVARLVAPDEELPGWYAFQHPLVVDALRDVLAPGERTEVLLRAADAVETVHPGLPGEWCQLAASLRLDGGEPVAAGRLFAEAGRRALAQGAAASAVTLLERAQELLREDTDGRSRAEAFAGLVQALAEAGQAERTAAAAGELDRIAGLLDRPVRARLHTRLAWAAVLGGRPQDGQAQLEAARRLLGPDAPDEQTAPIDVVAAHLALDLPGDDPVGTAERLARRAAEIAERVPLPAIGCQAWQLLGALTRARDPVEATECLERARALAVRYHLPIEEIHALIRLGNDDALHHGGIERLEQVRRESAQFGAVLTQYQAEASLGLQAILRGEFGEAEAMLERVIEVTGRLRLLETARYALLLRAVLHGHRGQRAAMESDLAELRRAAGTYPAQDRARIHGLARAWCALLEEDRDRARTELDRAGDAEQGGAAIFQLTGRHGLRLLLAALAGQAAPADHDEVAYGPVGRLRWERQFIQFAQAVLAGRAGEYDEAARALDEALRTAGPYTTARHLGLRLVAEAALADGWGSPVEWLRSAEEHFHQAEVPAVAAACRTLLRRAGAPVRQRRTGAGEVPAELRKAGVTVREFEVLRLLVDRLGNREIATRLHLSPRTVEKHVASLMAKTGRPDRIALAEFAADQ